MCVSGLRIDLPRERPACPLRADERILAADEIEVAGPEQAIEIRLRDERVNDIAQTIGRFVPACGGGAACWVLDGTVKGRISRSDEPESVAVLSEIEEVELRDDWLTARMRLRDAP